MTHDEERHILTGTSTYGARFRYTGCGAAGVNAKQCTVLRQNEGLVYAE